MADLIDILAPIEQEGTKAVVRNWLKAVGEFVSSDEPLVELETDKVTQEVPAPIAGVLHEILMESGDNAEPGSVLGRIKLQSAEAAERSEPATDLKTPFSSEPSAEVHYSPAVRRAAAEYGINPAGVRGTGKDGRVTRADMDDAHASRAGRATPEEETSPAAPPTRTEAIAAPVMAPQAPATQTSAHEDAKSRKIKHTPMRLAIANHMQSSVSSAPHVTAVFEADFTAIMRHRDQNKAKLAASGISLSYTAYIVAACVSAMKEVPEINSQWHDDGLEVFDDINIGIGTALGDKGLVVPVIKQAQNLSLSGIASKLQDLTTRARSNTLAPSDMRGGTFTISNHGVSGSLFASPIIINQPQSAILGVGKLEKRVVVREVDGIDTMQVRPMAYVSLTVDHRSLDGHQTNTWLTLFVKTLESWPS